MPGPRQHVSRRDLCRGRAGGGATASPLAEGGDANACFGRALKLLDSSSASDLYRVHLNYANYLLRQCKTGCTTTHSKWRRRRAPAADGFDFLARRLRAIRPGPRRARTPARKGFRRCQSCPALLLLADIINTFDRADRGEQKYAALAEASGRLAMAYAKEAVKCNQRGRRPVCCGSGGRGSGPSGFPPARFGDMPDARAESPRRLPCHGFPGWSGKRTSAPGLQYLRDEESRASAANKAASRQTALRQLLIAHVLSEILRERFPAERASGSVAPGSLPGGLS